MTVCPHGLRRAVGHPLIPVWFTQTIAAKVRELGIGSLAADRLLPNQSNPEEASANVTTDEEWLRAAAQWAISERRYQRRRYDGPPSGPEAVLVDRGSRVLLVAPHSVNHYRGNRDKLADRYTGGLVEVLGELAGVSVLTATRKSAPWASWGTRADEFKKALDRIAPRTGLALDFHGMSDEHGIDFCLGLGPASGPAEREAADRIAEDLTLLRVTSGDPFPATAEYTVTSYMQTVLRVPCLQIELAAENRRPDDGRADRAATVLAGLTRSITTLETTETAID
jgi:hypothetical protein